MTNRSEHEWKFGSIIKLVHGVEPLEGGWPCIIRDRSAARVIHASTKRDRRAFVRRDRKTDYDDGRVDSPFPENKEVENKLEGERIAPLQLPVANPFWTPRRGCAAPSRSNAVHHPSRWLVNPIKLWVGMCEYFGSFQLLHPRIRFAFRARVPGRLEHLTRGGGEPCVYRRAKILAQYFRYVNVLENSCFKYSMNSGVSSLRTIWSFAAVARGCQTVYFVSYLYKSTEEYLLCSEEN